MMAFKSNSDKKVQIENGINKIQFFFQILVYNTQVCALLPKIVYMYILSKKKNHATSLEKGGRILGRPDGATILSTASPRYGM